MMSNGETPTIFGDGSTSRDFVYIDNVVSANLLAAKATGNVSGRVFNIATGERTTLLEAYETIKSIVGYTGSVQFKPERVGDIRHSLADISQAKEELGYRVIVPFKEGINNTIQHCKMMARLSVL
jgi:UDP-glucose 4-epimerase